MRYNLFIFASIVSLSLTFGNSIGMYYKQRISFPIRQIVSENSNLGVDIIESVFDICDDKETEGLTLTEVEQEHCMSHLKLVFGILEEDIARNFEAIDENGDGLISKQESVKAYQTIGLDRINSDNNFLQYVL